MPNFRDKIRILTQIERPQKGVTHIRRGTNLSYIIQGVVAIPLPLGILLALLLASVLAGLVLLIKLDYTDVAKVQGFLTPVEKTVKVAAPSGWIVKELNVTLDQTVKKGDRLFTLTRDTTVGSSTSLIETIRTTIDKQNNEIEQQRQAGLAQYRAVIENSDKIIQEHLDAHKILESKQAQAENMIAQMKQRRQDIKQLFDERIISKDQLNQIDLQIEQLESQRKDLKLQMAENQKAITQIKASKEDAKAKLDQGLAQLNLQKEQIAAREIETKQSTELSIDSPTDGVIAKLDINQGSAITNKVDVMEIMPSRKLWAELYVPTSKGGFLRCNNPVKLAFQAYPFEVYGTFSGRLVYIPITAYTAPELGLSAQSADSALFYKVYAEVDDLVRFGSGKIFKREGKLINFKPGMIVEADIKIDSRSLLEWLFPPIYRMRERMFAEGRDKEKPYIQTQREAAEPSWPWFANKFPNLYHFFFGGKHYTGETHEDWSCRINPFDATTTSSGKVSHQQIEGKIATADSANAPHDSNLTQNNPKDVTASTPAESSMAVSSPPSTETASVVTPSAIDRDTNKIISSNSPPQSPQTNVVTGGIKIKAEPIDKKDDSPNLPSQSQQSSSTDDPFKNTTK